MNNNLEIVFFHELGHYIANHLIYKNFGIGQIDRIILIRKYTHEVDFEGQTQFKIPEGESSNKPLENLPEKLASLIYGCYFQSLYTSQNLDLCFNPMKHCKGSNDYSDFGKSLKRFEIENYIIFKLLDYIQNEYFESLKDENILNKSVFEINPNEFLIKDGDTYDFDLAKIEKSIENAIISHQPTFINFISEIKSILNWENVG